MSESIDANNEDVLRGFQEAIRRGGHGLKYSLLKLNEGLARRERSDWRFIASHFPVEARNRVTHIDLILQRWRPRIYMLAHCKVADPLYQNWCFASAPRITAHYDDRLVLDCTHVDENEQVQHYVRHSFTDRKFVHIGSEVRSDSLEAGAEQQRSHAFRRAVAQANNWVSGISKTLASNINFFPREEEFFRRGRPRSICLLPVIFTTADIWVAEADLSSAAIESGRIDLAPSGLTKSSWVLYQEYTVREEKLSTLADEQPRALEELMEKQYVRTIPVVNPSGVAEFLHWASKFELY